MKYVEKHNPEPPSFGRLAGWVTAHRARLKGLTGADQWALLPRQLKKQLQDQLIEEQGYICAYCNGRVHKGNLEDDEQLRIEHIQPKGLLPDLTFDYHNLVGCCHGDEREGERVDPPRDPHCDVSKGASEIPPDLFPTSSTCECCLAYSDEGEVLPTDPVYQDAIETILNLNADKLVRKRKAKIEPFVTLDFYHKEAQQIVQQLQTPDADGRLDPYCGAAIGYIRTNFSLLP